MDALSKIAFVVNGGPQSAMADRAQQMAERLIGAWDIVIFYREASGLRDSYQLSQKLRSARPQLVYVFDMGLAGCLAALAYKFLNCQVRVVIDSGDDLVAVARTLGRGALGLVATFLLDYLATRLADHLVVRGSFHKESLAKRGFSSTVIPDGVNVELLQKQVSRVAKSDQEPLLLGVIGSVQNNGEHTYGMELVRALEHLRDAPVEAVLIGDGPGLEAVKQLAQQVGVESRMHFPGALYGEPLFEWMSRIDIAVSTQTNDRVGRVRTTGKLPLYMATGCYVLATDVGQASLILDDSMLVPYEGSFDGSYPAKLAERVREILADRSLLEHGTALVELAQRNFCYDLLSHKLHEVLSQFCGPKTPLANLGKSA